MFHNQTLTVRRLYGKSLQLLALFRQNEIHGFGLEGWRAFDMPETKPQRAKMCLTGRLPGQKMALSICNLFPFCETGFEGGVERRKE